MTNDTTINCPRCKCEHGLFYFVDSHGKRSLCYICDRVEHHNTTGNLRDKHGLALQMVYRTERVTCPDFIDGLPIREEWSRGWKGKKQAEAELQFPLMTKKP